MGEIECGRGNERDWGKREKKKGRKEERKKKKERGRRMTGQGEGK